MLGQIGARCGAGCGGRNRHRLEVRRHRRRDGDVARDPHPQARALDLDLGQAGLIQQQREFANERAVVALQVCGICPLTCCRAGGPCS